MSRSRLVTGVSGGVAFAMLAFGANPVSATVTPIDGFVIGSAISTVLEKKNQFPQAKVLMQFGTEVKLEPQVDLNAYGTDIKNGFSTRATWDNATSGHINFDSSRSITSTDPYSLMYSGVSIGTEWLYVVAFDKPTTLTLKFQENWTDSFNRRPSAEFDVRSDDGSFNTLWGETDDPSAQGTVTYHFDPGDYQFSFLEADQSPFFLDADYSSAFHAQFDWSFKEDGAGDGGNGSVPEPASWASMLGGFGMVGGALRASKRKVALTLG